MTENLAPLPKRTNRWTPFRLSNVGKPYVYQHEWIEKATPKSLLADLSAKIVFRGHIASSKRPRAEHANLQQKFRAQLSPDSEKTDATHLSFGYISKWLGLDEVLMPILAAQGSYPFPWLGISNNALDQDTLIRAIVMLGNRRCPGARQDDDNIRLIFWTLAKGKADAAPLVTRGWNWYNHRSNGLDKADPPMQRDPYITDVLDVVELTRDKHCTHSGEKIVPARRQEFELFALRLLKDSNAPSGYPKAIDPGKFERFSQAMNIVRKPSATLVTLEEFETYAKEVQLVEKLDELAEKLLEFLCK